MDKYDGALDSIKKRMEEIVGELSSVAESLTKEEQEELNNLMEQYSEKVGSIKGKIWKRKLEILRSDLKTILPPLSVEVKEDIKENPPLTENVTPSNGESKIIIVNHPVDSSFRFLAVLNDIPLTFDINKARQDLMDWFSSLPVEFADSIHFEELYNAYLNKVRLLGKDIHKSLNGQEEISSSFAGLIVGHDKTVVASAGNTNVFCYYEQKIASLEINNKRRSYPFGYNDIDLISTTTLNNDNYSTLVLSSKGNEDSIEDDRVKIICKDTNRESLALEFLDTSRKEQKGMI